MLVAYTLRYIHTAHIVPTTPKRWRFHHKTNIRQILTFPHNLNLPVFNFTLTSKFPPILLFCAPFCEKNGGPKERPGRISAASERSKEIVQIAANAGVAEA